MDEGYIYLIFRKTFLITTLTSIPTSDTGEIFAPLKTFLKYFWMINIFAVPPLGVKIMTEDQPMVSGREYNLKCVSWGSLPPAEISWYRRQSFGSKVMSERDR